MEALAYWKAVTADKAGFLERVVALLAESDVKYCVIGGQAVNAFVEPVVSLDLDLAVATADVDPREPANSSSGAGGSALAVLVATDQPRQHRAEGRPRSLRGGEAPVTIE